MLPVSLVLPIEEEAAIATLPIPPSTTDDELVTLWLHGKSPHTRRAYAADIAVFRAITGKTLRTTYLSDLQKYADVLQGSPATQARRLKTLKSLLSFAARMGYLPFNVGAAIRGPKVASGLAERILSEQQINIYSLRPWKITPAITRSCVSSTTAGYESPKSSRCAGATSSTPSPT